MNPEPTDLNDLAAIARTTKSPRYRRALAFATAEIERLRAGGCARDQKTTQYCGEAVALQAEVNRLRARVAELEAHADWHIDMVVGDAWLCRIEGKYEDIADLLGNAVGKEIQSYEIDTSHHENTHE
jgi:hypothetical protein